MHVRLKQLRDPASKLHCGRKDTGGLGGCVFRPPVVACLRNVTKVKTSIRIQSAAAGHTGNVVCPCCWAPTFTPPRIHVSAPYIHPFPSHLRCTPRRSGNKVKPIKTHAQGPRYTSHWYYDFALRIPIKSVFNSDLLDFYFHVCSFSYLLFYKIISHQQYN